MRPAAGCSTASILDAAVAAGADLSLGTAVEGCLRGAATASRALSCADRTEDGAAVHADLVIGADGRMSRIAELVGAQPLLVSPQRTATLYGYFPNIPNEGYRWYFGDGVVGRRHSDQRRPALRLCRLPARRLQGALRRRPAERHGARSSAGSIPNLPNCILAAPSERLRRFLGAPGHMRARAGEGWALVGDAAFFKDPATAHGITDALARRRRLVALPRRWRR